jgi:dTDP-4-dehydrorhamnose reductase
MILLLGATGYVGTAFCRLFDLEGVKYLSATRKEVDYTDPLTLRKLIREANPSFLINCAGFTGKPNVDACEVHKPECLFGNAVLPGLIRSVCESEKLAWGHVSSGCIYTGSRPDGTGFTEEDDPNFSFRTNNCSFYSGTKALGEECLDGAGQNYVWRLRIPFNSVDNSRNYLTKLLRYERLLDATNSLSHLDEFVWACWQTWEKKIPYGIYNVTNPGSVTTREVVELMQNSIAPNRSFSYFESEEQFMNMAAKTPRSNCSMDSTKLADAGIKMRPIQQAIAESLVEWSWEKKPMAKEACSI